MLKYILIFIFLIQSFTLFSQEQQVTQRTMQWYSERSLELHSGVEMTHSCQITTSPENIELIWGEQHLNFPIENSEGSWSDPVTEGKIIYHILYGNLQGKGTLERTNEELTMTFDFTSEGPQGMLQKIYISRFE